MTLKRNLAWMGIGQGTFFILQFAGSVVLARLLTPYEMGVFALAAAIVGALGIIQSFGIGSYIVREKSLEPGDISTAFTLNALLAIALSAIILVGAFVADSMMSAPGVRLVLTILAFVPLAAIFELLPFSQIERAGQFKLLMLVGLAKNLTATACTVTLAFGGYSFLSMAWGQLAGAFVGVLALNIVGRRHAQFRLSLSGWRRLTLFGMHMLAISGVNSLATRASDILLGKIGGLHALGLFNRSTNVYRLFWDNLHLVIGRVIFVDLAQRKRNGESLRESYLLISEVMTATLWPAFAGLAILAAPMFNLVYGANWVGAALPFSLLAVAAIIQVSITMTWELFTISGETARQARIEIVRTTVGLAMFTAACFVSIAAAAATRVLEALFSMLLYRSHLERMTDTSLRDFLPIYARSGVLTALAVAPAIGLMAAWRNDPNVPVWQLAAAVAGGVLLWITGLYLMRHPLVREARLLLARRRQP